MLTVSDQFDSTRGTTDTMTWHMHEQQFKSIQNGTATYSSTLQLIIWIVI